MFVHKDTRGQRIETGQQSIMNPPVTSSNPVRPTGKEKGLRHVPGGPFSCPADEIPDYLIIAAPAWATWPS